MSCMALSASCPRRPQGKGRGIWGKPVSTVGCPGHFPADVCTCSEALERSRIESEKRQQRKAKERERAEQRRKDLEAGCNWGFAEDAYEDEEGEEEGYGDNVFAADSYDPARRRDATEEELLGGGQEGRMFRPKPTSLVELTRKAAEAAGGIHEADTQLFERMMKRRQKIENLQSEITRIKTKAGSEGLSEGQQHHVRKVEEKIEELQRQVEDNEETLRHRNQQRQASTSKARKRANGEDDYNSEDDEFFDRTIVAKRQKNAKEHEGPGETAVPSTGLQPVPVETWESLSAKASLLDKSIRELEDTIASQITAAVRVDNDTKATVVASAVDELDAFMQSNDVVFASDTVQALRSELATLIAERNRLGRLLALAKPALSGLKARAHSEQPSTLPTSPKSPDRSGVGPAAKQLTGIDKKQAYWKEKMKGTRQAGGAVADVTPTVNGSEDRTAVDAMEALEAAAPKHAGLGSGTFSTPSPSAAKPANAAVTALKAAVNRLPGSAEIVSSYKPGLNAMK
jgi:hypothetical protein